MYMWAAKFFWLIFAHFLGDYVFQTDTMAKYKNWNNPSPAPPGQTQQVCWYYWMTAHSVIHGGLVAMFTGSIVLGVLETVIHFLTDCLKCAGKTNIHQDQAIHIGCKLLWSIL